MEKSEMRKSVRLKETQTAEDIISSFLTASDENQNKMLEAEVEEAVKHNSENLEERSPTSIKSHSCSVDHGSHSGTVPPGPSPALLASLQSLVEHNDHMLLPHSLHQIAEGYFLEKDYQWSVEFLHLEKLYHERLLSNLASIQKEWESQRKIIVQTESNSNGTDREREHMELLSHICRTHQRPNLVLEKNMDDKRLHNSPTLVSEHRRSKPEQASVNSTERENRADDCSWLGAEQEPEEDCELNDEEEEEEEEEEEADLEEDESWTEELQDDTVVDGQVPVADFQKYGLVSILKKRVYVKETENALPLKDSTKPRVRFREPEDAFDQDESARNSCLILLILCLVTVVISMGGTALYCLVGEAYSNVCVDFSQNVDFYFGPVRRGVDALVQWLSSDGL
ncbi:consortin-like [Carassius carassius]|uniref:consortin-like n=1 Tax=Carassius carassius TaxID=217509 RepID=UPI00286878F4|nr:consortin-like [Carassius carassius]